jgi:hypothetical protein
MSVTFRKGKWKGSQGGSKEEWVILELAAMSSISYLDIGNLGAAFIEIKVGRDQHSTRGGNATPTPAPLPDCNYMES